MRLGYIADIVRLGPIVQNPVEVTWFREKNVAGSECEVRFRKQPPVRLRGSFPDRHMFQRIFVQDEYRLGRYGARGWGNVLDLGANVGLFSARVAPFADKVIGYEPVPDNFEVLERNLDGLDNVTLVQAGVAASPGSLTLHRPSDPTLTGTFSAHEDLGDGLMGHETIEVPVEALDDVLDRHGLDEVSLMKIDVEGQEYDILENASERTLARIGGIVGEYHDVSLNGRHYLAEDLVKCLDNAGFTIDLEPHRKKPNHGMFFATR